MICPYCEMEVSDSAIEAEEGYCPECGTFIMKSSFRDDGDDDLEEIVDLEDDLDDLDDLVDLDDDLDLEEIELNEPIEDYSEEEEEEER